MVAFYRDMPVEDCDANSHGDMLLVQWGTYDWGRGQHFEFDVTRQMIPRVGDDDDIWQLHLTVRFPPTADLQALGAGNRWCRGTQGVQEFCEFVTTSAAFLAVADRRDGTATLDFDLLAG